MGVCRTSVGIWQVLNNLIGYEMSLNDVCCYVPAWGGVSATFFLGLITLECTGSWASGSAAMYPRLGLFFLVFFLVHYAFHSSIPLYTPCGVVDGVPVLIGC